MSINGAVNPWHLQVDEPWGFTYCSRYKIICDRVTIELHQGFSKDTIILRCPKCKKAIWKSNLDRKQIKDNKECDICKKPTNDTDCKAICYSELYRRGKPNYICSEKCCKLYDKKMDKLIEKQILEALKVLLEERMGDAGQGELYSEACKIESLLYPKQQEEKCSDGLPQEKENGWGRSYGYGKECINSGSNNK